LAAVVFKRATCVTRASAIKRTERRGGHRASTHSSYYATVIDKELWHFETAAASGVNKEKRLTLPLTKSPLLTAAVLDKEKKKKKTSIERKWS